MAGTGTAAGCNDTEKAVGSVEFLKFYNYD